VSYAVPATPATGNSGLLTMTELAQPVNAGEPRWSTDVANSSREFTGFNIYRNGSLLVSNVQTTTYTYLEGAAGSSCYTVTAVYSLCGESEPSNEACVDFVTGVENNDLSQVKVYPNPSNSIVNIDLTNNISRVIVYNYVSQVVFEQNNTKAGTIQLNVNNYESGAYLVKFVTSAGESFTKKVVVIK
ncbi:MAG: T9SS type A sorting domain-containing protein, partial [Lentimicrobium sp.]|nr:T9SS type A sorting domain-containing protein [Lentimicrobium sp.]